MKQWMQENSDKLMLAGMVVMFFLGAFVAIKFSNQTMIGAALDNMKFVLGALVGVITGARLSNPNPPSGPPPVPGV